MHTPARLLLDSLDLLGAFLEGNGHQFDVVVVGGAALLLQGLSLRTTADVDVVALYDAPTLLSAKPLPPELLQAVAMVAESTGLASDWLNNGPEDLLRLGLPVGFEARLVVRKFGCLTLRLASRQDLVALKLCAAADRGSEGEAGLNKHFQDLWALKPDREELLWAARWARTQSAGEVFEDELRRILWRFEVRLDDV